MGQHLAKLVLLSMPLGGCSLLYDPNGLPPAADAAPDAPPVIVPCELALEDVTPSLIVEGAGVGGSRPALIVIHGVNIVKDDTSVSIVVAAGSTRTPMMSIDNVNLEVGDFGHMLAVPITLPVDTSLPAEMVPLDVTVTQNCPGGPVTKSLTGKLVLKGLPELTSAAMPLAGGIHEYSQINVEMGTLTPAPNQTSPLVLRSASSVKIANDISVSAAGRSGGPAGGMGGAGGPALGSPGTPGTGPYAGLPSGGVGRFESTDLGLSTLNNPNRSSGGAGGNGAVLAGGGDGGGGGGSLEISAAGDLQVAATSARGEAGEPAGGGGSGGGGSGGVILLRAGGTLTADEIDVSGGGGGHRGRARYDAGGVAMVPAGEFGTDHFRGPMFVNPLLIARSATPELTVTGKPLSSFRYFFINSEGSVKGPFSITIGAGGTSRLIPDEELYRGLNQICLVVENATATSDTRNCIDIAYLR